MSTGFSFGTKTTAAPAFGSTSLTFGGAANQNQPLSFGNPAPTAGTPSLFGTSTPASAPATTATMFGSTGQAPATGMFGTPGQAPATGMFGTPGQAPATGMFGTSGQAPATGMFGTPGQTPATGMFGTPGQAPATGMFGSPGQAPATGMFGTPGQAPATGMFGTPGQAPATGMFGAPANTSAPNLSFGANTTGFGATSVAATAPASTFGTPASTAAPATSFGLGAGQSATPNLTLGSGMGASTTSTSAAPSFGFGLNTSNTGGLKLGSTPTMTATPSLNFGLGGLAPTTSTSISLTPAAATTASPGVGLGGIATSTQAKSSAVTTQKEVPPKDQPLPNEILQTVEAFKELVKQQKAHSSDISRCSVRDFRRVEQEINQLSNHLNEVERQLQKNRQIAEKLKYDTAKTVQNVEMAQRTHDTPPGLQYENTAPLKFFLNLADQFERDMQNLKMQIEAADKYVKNHKNPDSLTPPDLSMGMRRLHETFVALAGRLQSVHSQVESQKDTYLNIRKHLLQDTTNPFDKLTRKPEFHVSNMQNAFIHSPPKVATGPTPFNNLALRTMSAGAPQQHTTPPPPYPGPSTSTGTGFGSTGFGTPLGGAQPSNTLLFGSNYGQTTFDSSFQLQKPPTGNKRGKI